MAKKKAAPKRRPEEAAPKQEYVSTRVPNPRYVAQLRAQSNSRALPTWAVATDRQDGENTGQES